MPILLGLWLVLLLVLGLVAMHNMGGGTSHVMATPSGPHAAAQAIGEQPAVTPLATTHVTLPTVTTHPVDTVASVLDHAPSHAMAMCLAILLGLLVPRVRQHLLGVTVAPVGVGLLVRARSLPLGRGPPRSLLARLCILRT